SHLFLVPVTGLDGVRFACRHGNDYNRLRRWRFKSFVFLYKNKKQAKRVSISLVSGAGDRT
ncbi:MAG: hypothetical protein J6L89_05075, partial [Clostridia bacterium]|nr:hypothetical protein [Clostridia bacterium]